MQLSLSVPSVSWIILCMKYENLLCDSAGFRGHVRPPRRCGGGQYAARGGL